MADDNQLNQLPLQPPGQGMFPPMNPVGPSMPSDDDLQRQLLQSSQVGTQAFQSQLARANQQGDQTAPLEQQQAQLAQHLGFHPDFSGGIGHKIGEGMLSFLAATKPGQAVQDVVYSKPRQQYADVINQIRERQRGQQLEQEPLPSAAGLVYHPYMASASLTRANADQQRAQAYAQNVQNELMTRMRGLDIRALEVGSQVELNKAKTILEQAMPAILQQRNQLMQYGIDVASSTHQAIANVESQLGIEKSHPFLQLWDQITGQQNMPAAPQIPTGQQPTLTKPTKPGTQQKPQGSNKQQGKGTVRLQSGGVFYNVPRHLLGEFKKDHPDAR